MEILSHVFKALWISSATYLGWRALVAICRIRWARFSYPKLGITNLEHVSEWGNRCRGCLVGLGIGDALNLPAESLPRWLPRLRYPAGPKMRRGFVRFLRRPGDVSDDTQLMIAVARRQ